MPQEFKDYVVFPVGSYWIYEDSLSNNVDSLYLTSVDIHIQEIEKSNYFHEEMFQYFYSSQNNKLTARTRRFSSNNIYEYYGYGYYFDITKGQTNCTGGTLYAKYDSLKVLNVWYKDVVCIKGNGMPRFYYWVKNIGLIKKENADSSENWLLKSYHINN